MGPGSWLGFSPIAAWRSAPAENLSAGRDLGNHYSPSFPLNFKKENKEESPRVIPCRACSPGTWDLSHPCWLLLLISPSACSTPQESGAPVNPGQRCPRQDWMESAMPGEGGGSPRPGRSSKENWLNPLGVSGSSFTIGSQPVRVRKAEAFFTGFSETFGGEILAWSSIL